jgi:hypothetical protein
MMNILARSAKSSGVENQEGAISIVFSYSNEE